VPRTATRMQLNVLKCQTMTIAKQSTLQTVTQLRYDFYCESMTRLSSILLFIDDRTVFVHNTLSSIPLLVTHCLTAVHLQFAINKQRNDLRALYNNKQRNDLRAL